MTRVSNGQMQHIRTNTHKRKPPHELRVVRTVAKDQTGLFGTLDTLRETTGNFVDYKDNDRLGVTVMMLGPLLQRLLGVGAGRQVPLKDLQETETDLKRAMQGARYQQYNVPLLDPAFNPLDLYGVGKKWLGIRLSPRVLWLAGERAMVEKYFKDTYELSNRDLGRHLVDLRRPHITIGEVRYDQMTADQVAAIRANPSDFVLGADRARQERLVELEGRPALELAVFPDEIGLNGLTIACQPKGS